MKTVNILGTEYTIEVDESLDNKGLDGLCKGYDKQITLRNVGSMLCDDDSTETKRKRYNEVLRHEIIHAFLVNQVLMIIQAMNSLLIGLQFSFQR